MRRSQFAAFLVFGSAGLATVFSSGCSSDDGSTASGGSSGEAGSTGGKGGTASSAGGKGGTTPGAGGNAGTGTAGHGGVTGVGGHAVGGNGGSTSVAGSGGSGGSVAGEGGIGQGGIGQGGVTGFPAIGNGGEGGAAPCGPSLTLPEVPSDIHVAESAVLVAAFAAEGTQTYTCAATGTGTVTYAWSTTSVPSAKLYDSDCMVAVSHYGGPHWKANDGSIILGTKVRAVASATTGSIPQLLLSAVADGGTTGLLSNVTAVQRLNTVGGVAPATGCDTDHVGGTVAVPYTAEYYFYSGADIIPTL